MRWESLVSTQNLRLAWRRINTGRNPHYKRFFRDFYLVYETALEKNLKVLKQKLYVHAWKASHAQRIYIPKPSGLQRPISLLGLEDQILLQAVANIIAKKITKKRKSVELRCVFSNALSELKGSIFFLQPWQKTYSAFQEKCKTLFREGNEWIAHFDLAAYYDTISHDMLFRIISPRNRHPETWEEVKKWLRVWSASQTVAMTTHGIPQGPIASDFLAEAFFLPIDIELQKRSIRYVRYVDDIRLFGEDENEVRRAGIMLECLCRDRGLIPQGKKFAISRAKNLEEALGILPSIPPTEDSEEPDQMNRQEALRFLRSCIGGKPLKVKNKSRFRYVMYRAPNSPKVLDKVLLLMPRHPEHIDAFAAFFSNYVKNKRIAKVIINILCSGLPYNYVRGELWHLLARLGTQGQLEQALEMARNDAREREKCLGLSWGVMNFLLRCQEEGLCSIGTRLNAEHPMSRALLASRIPQTEFVPKKVVVSMLKGTLEEQLAAARLLQTKNCSLSHLNLGQQELSQVCRNSLRALGVIRRAIQATSDWIGERLEKRYGGSLSQSWRSLLGAEYEHALQMLIEADAMIELTRSNWLQIQDSFNDIVIRQFIIYLRQRGLPGGEQRIITKNGRFVKYGTLLQGNGPLAVEFPTIQATLLKVHDRRNKLPGSHPYDEKGGAQNRWLTIKERNLMLNYTGQALRDIATFVNDHP